MSVSPTDEPAGNTQPTSFFSIATGLGADDGVFPLDALPPHPPTASTATHALAPTSHMFCIVAAYADARQEVGQLATTTQRGLGWQHQRQRRALLAKHHDGDLCEHCGKPMYKTQPLQADHSIPRSLGGTKADRLLHAWCNESRGNGTRVPTDTNTWTPGVTSRDWFARDTPAEKSENLAN